MPWRIQAMKDVARCDKLLGSGNRGYEYRGPEYIGFMKRTRGTETSQYLEEKTSTEIPLVVASERGPGQCFTFN
jgi:hypothetical protein